MCNGAASVLKRKVRSMGVEPANKSSVPAWVGRYPYPPEQKQPVLVSRDKAVLFTFGQGAKRVSCTTHISTDLVQCGIMMIPPGGTFWPPDIHAGDEVYFVRSGEIAVYDPQTGTGVRARAGEYILIPKGMWHQSFCLSSENVEVYAFIAPLQWKEGETDVPDTFKAEPNWLTDQRPIVTPMGHWPASGDSCVTTIQRLGYEDAIGVVRGKDVQLPIFFHVSSNHIHVGEFTLPVGLVSEAESHTGDEVLFVVSGVLGIRVCPSEGDSDSPVKDIFEIQAGEAFLIPSRRKHEYLNLASSPTKVVFAAAPEL